MEKQVVFNDVQAARYLGLAPQSLRNLRHYRKGPPYCKLGRRVVYKIADLDQYLAERRIDPGSRRRVHGGDVDAEGQREAH